VPPSTSNDYDRVAYPTMAHPQTFAECLSIKGFLRGLDVARPERCRVLELGCGDGFNLAAMAAIYPESSYTGVDYSAEAIERGRGLMAELGLKQVRLETADIRALSQLEPELGQFGYIIAHGVYSWVPVEVRNALLAAIDRLLAPQGVAFVSYLALPGAHMRELVRTIIRFHTQATPNPTLQVEQSRSLLKLIATGSTLPNHYTQWIADELVLIDNHAGEALFHDELSSISAPLLFTEFITHAGQHGLQFLSEAESLLPISRALTDEAREQLRPLEQHRVLLEQYLDFMEGRRFRQTLLCRPGLGEKLEQGRLDQLWVSCRATPGNGPVALADPAPLGFFGHRKAELRASTPATKAALLELTSRPGEAMPFPALLAATRDRLLREGLTPEADFEPALRFYLCRAGLPGLIEFTWSQLPWTTSVAERPFAHPLARWMLAQGAPSVLSYTGRFVEVNGILGRRLLSLLDGTRDHVTLAAEMRGFLAVAHDEARLKGESANLPAPDDPALAAQLQRSLTGLANLGLLRRE
jgi:SAM-dependent methyltransferase